MKRKEKIYLLVGVFLGIILSINLTLYFWGNLWWQIILSIRVGACFGFIMTNYFGYSDLIVRWLYGK